MGALDGKLAILTGAGKAAAVEPAAPGMRVNSLHPGLIDTSILDALPVGAADQLDATISFQPPGHPTIGRPEDIAAARLHLASDARRFITGAELAVDGGSGAV
jgi:3alpha(or 20beta)-hydroxysteroid dehydrogenase